jgi:predicted AlkP superfamily phosphohydrolase/phosphomutase
VTHLLTISRLTNTYRYSYTLDHYQQESNTMPAGILVIGLDAAEATLIETWAADGSLPNLAKLISGGATYTLDNSLETLPGAIWPELATGRSGGQVPRYYHSRKLHTGEAAYRAIEAEDVDANDYYWVQASRAGRRVAVIDIPQTVESTSLNGIQLTEWGLHDRSFTIASTPPTLLDDIRARYGDHPVAKCDRHQCQPEGYQALRDDLLAGARTKTQLMLDIMEREDWDLFTCCYGETHCVGHQFWHFQDEGHAWYDPDAPAAFRDAIHNVYQQIDTGLGKLIAAAGPEATVLVVASHGMGPYTGGPQLLPEILIRLGFGSNGSRGTLASRALRKAQELARHLPRSLQPVLRSLAGTGPVKGIQAGAGALLNPLESSKTRACALRNNRCGAIRLNLRGREPFGEVEPGAEAAAIIAEIKQSLLALTDPASGQPIVDHITTADEAFGPEHHPDVPDMMVVFRTDLGVLERCTSARVGDIHVENYHPNIPRSGDHTVESRLWAFGPGINPDIGAHQGNVLDLAPTLLSLLNVPVPPTIDGRPLTGSTVWGRPAQIHIEPDTDQRRDPAGQHNN